MDQLYRAVCAVEPAPAAGRHCPAAWQRATRRDRRAAGKCGAAAIGLSRLPLGAIAPAWPCARPAALPLRAVRTYLQCLDGHAAGPLAPQGAVARLRRLPAGIGFRAQGGAANWAYTATPRFAGATGFYRWQRRTGRMACTASPKPTSYICWNRKRDRRNMTRPPRRRGGHARQRGISQ